jgi:hypothetical protein
MGEANQLIGWSNDSSGTVTAPAEIMLLNGTGPGTPLLRLSIDPAAPALTALATGGALHYFRFADATLRPLPADPPALPFARGDAYIAVTPGALRLATGPAIARYIHVRDDFNAEGLAQGLLDFLGEQAGPAGVPEDVTVLVIEAR